MKLTKIFFQRKNLQILKNSLDYRFFRKSLEVSSISTKLHIIKPGKLQGVSEKVNSFQNLRIKGEIFLKIEDLVKEILKHFR